MSRHAWPALPRALAASAVCAAMVPAFAAAHDYPTYERVQYVIQCLGKYGGAQQLIYQCSCAIDKLADQFPVDDYVEMQTAVNASSITGERGGELRDNEAVRAAGKRYRAAEQAALKSCGVAVP